MRLENEGLKREVIGKNRLKGRKKRIAKNLTWKENKMKNEMEIGEYLKDGRRKRKKGTNEIRLD